MKTCAGVVVFARAAIGRGAAIVCGTAASPRAAGFRSTVFVTATGVEATDCDEALAPPRAPAMVARLV